MAQKVMLRRKSFVVLAWLGSILGFGFAMIAALELGNDFHHDNFLVMAISLAFVPFARRIWCSRVVLDSGALVVVNPVRVYRVPYRDVVRVTATGGGTLLVVTSGGMEIPSTGFGGSVIDAFVGSTNKAIDTAEREVRRRRGSSDKEPGTVRFSRDLVGDICLVAALACLVIHVVSGR